MGLFDVDVNFDVIEFLQPHHIVRSKFFFVLPQIHLLVAVAVSLAIAIACEPVTGVSSLCLSESVTIQELKNLEEKVKRNQSLKSLLLSPSGDFVISYYGNKIAVFEFKSKMVGLYFGRVHMKDALTLLSI
ncbi:putative nucleoredoxin [Arachis hypogaea]|nr:putative nucleoredoxin [Arachis hypogaea]